MKPFLRFLAILFIAALAGLGVTWWFSHRSAKDLPDERKVAMQLLADRQSGPGYFHPATAADKPDDQGVFWLPVEGAGSQIDRIVRERQGAVTREQLRQLIAEVAEPYPSRTIGGDRLNLARLNVALDALLDTERNVSH